MDYKNKYTGEVLNEKPEHMTSLLSNELVYKNHPRIVLRGYLSELIAKLLVYMNELMSQEKTGILDDVKQVLHWVKALQRSEVTNEPLNELFFHDMDMEEVQKRSHNPKEFYGRGHLFGLSFNENVDVLKINELKAFSRRVEIAAFEAYSHGENLEREDFVKAMNRLSSVLYVIELRILAGEVQ